MFKTLHRPLRAARPAAGSIATAFLSLLVPMTPATARDAPRPLLIEDVVRFEAFGRASISPEGGWAVYEKRGPYDTATRFDFGQRSPWTIMTLWRVDLRRPDGAAERIAPDEASALLCGEWSPSGRKLVICRLVGDRYEFGVLDIGAGTVVWTGLAPEIAKTGGTVEWADEDRVVLMVRPDGSLPRILRYYSGSQAKAVQDWRRTAGGAEPSRTIIDASGGALSSDTADADLSVVVLDVRSGETRTLATGDISDFTVSPDGTTLALVQGAEPVPVQPGEIVMAALKTRQRLVLLGLEGGAIVRTDPDLDVSPGLLRWSPGGEALLIWGRRDDQAWTDGDLMTVGRDGGLTTMVRDTLDPVDERRGVGYVRGVTADWMGSTPVLYARPGGGARFDWYGLGPDQRPMNLTREMRSPPSRLNSVTDAGVFMVADGGVWLAGPQGARRLTATDEVFADVSIPSTDKPVRLLFNSPPRQARAMAVSGSGVVVSIGRDGEVERLGGGGAARLRFSALSQGAALYLQTDQVVEALQLATPAGDRTIDRVNAAYRDVVLPLPVDLPHLDRMGRPTTSRLFLPQGRTLSEARGLILHVYPGTTQTGAWAGPQWLVYGLRAQILAGAGYAVLSPSIPDDPSGALRADDLVRDVDLAVDAALARYPELPKERMAVVGHSFGGHAALALATRSDRFRSYVSWSGASDLFSAWGEFTPVSRQMPDIGFSLDERQGWAETGQGGRKVPPWADIAAYVEGSPYLSADRIHAPVLLITADRDFVPVTHAERMFSALYRLGGRTRLVTYWGEEHFVLSPANVRDLYRQIFNWLDLTLGAPETGGAPTP